MRRGGSWSCPCAAVSGTHWGRWDTLGTVGHPGNGVDGKAAFGLHDKTTGEWLGPTLGDQGIVGAWSCGPQVRPLLSGPGSERMETKWELGDRRGGRRLRRAGLLSGKDSSKQRKLAQRGKVFWEPGDREPQQGLLWARDKAGAEAPIPALLAHFGGHLCRGSAPLCPQGTCSLWGWGSVEKHPSWLAHCGRHRGMSPAEPFFSL